MSDARKFPKITLAAARVNAGLSQDKAANMLEISKETLSNYERGKTTPDWNMVKKIESVYDFPSDFIFFGDELRFKRKMSKAQTA